MSVTLMGAVWRLAGLARSERDVLLALADHAHDDGTSARPGIPYLVWKLDLARSTIVGALSGLEEKRLIVPSAGRKGGRGRVTEYQLNLENGTEKAPFRKGPKVVPFDDLKGPIHEIKGPIHESETVRNSLARVDEPKTIEPSGEPSASGRKPSPVWDVVAEIYGEPVERFKAHRGRVVSDIRELLIRDGVRDSDVAQAEVRRRVAALAGEWGPGKATADSIVKHWRLAGELADQGVAGGLTPEQIFQQAVDQEGEGDDRTTG